MRIAPIVEGHGEVHAVPILLRRIKATIGLTIPLEITPPIRIQKTRLLKPGELERAINLAALRTSPDDGIIVLIDADDDCPATLSADLLSRAALARSDRRTRVVVAKFEYESWFLAAAESISGVRGLLTDLAPPTNPESIRDAKGWLRSHSNPGSGYRPVIDQPALTNRFDLQSAKRAPSFDKMYRVVESLMLGP